MTNPMLPATMAMLRKLVDDIFVQLDGIPEALQVGAGSAVDVFVEVIRRDPYLMTVWGDDVAKIRTALDRVIQLYP